MAEAGNDLNLGRPQGASLGMPPPSILPPGGGGMPSRGIPQMSTPGPPLPPMALPPMSTPGPPMPPGPPIPPGGSIMNLPPPPQGIANMPPHTGIVSIPPPGIGNMSIPPQGIPGMVPPPSNPMNNLSRPPPTPQGLAGMPPPQNLSNMPPPPPPQGLSNLPPSHGGSSPSSLGAMTPPPGNVTNTPPPTQLQGGQLLVNPPPQIPGGQSRQSQLQKHLGPSPQATNTPRISGQTPQMVPSFSQRHSTQMSNGQMASSKGSLDDSESGNDDNSQWANRDSGDEDGDDDGKLEPLMSVKVDSPEDDKNGKPSEVVLPKALEDVLALKDMRAAQFEGDVDVFSAEVDKQPINISSGVISTEYADADGESDEENEVPSDAPVAAGKTPNKLNKNKRKKKRRKQNRQRKTLAEGDFKQNTNETDKKGKKDNRDDVTIEYIPERITIADLAPIYRQFYRVFEIFKLENKPKQAETDKTVSSNDASLKQKKPEEKTMEDDDDDPEEDKKDEKERLSKRKLKKLTRLSVAELKQLVSRPDVVEMHDVTARDPKLLVQLKAHRNTVQVPRHWCFKRKYLQGKRGIEKPPFDLPAFIKKTGIMEMRESLQEKDEAKSLKAKMRERTRPKMGKIDIDYQKLHDAFFKWQTKPRMTIHGDLYYEGKEFETRLKEKKPGDLSEELRIALGMPVGPNCHKIPPPWLIAQQRYGPPPSYPNLKIPGLNAPIPDGTSFGYHAGGWGKPPVDESGKPLYGDVFGTNVVDLDNGVDEGDIERNTWGELESESEESSEEEEEEGEDLANPPDESGLVTPAEGLVTPSGLTSVPAGMETPDNIELRKKKIEAEMEDNETPVLYQVLPEKRTDRLGTSMMASTHVYDIASANKAAAAGALRVQPPIADREGMVELALDPSELDMDNDAMAQRYEQQMREQQSHLQKEDLSDMLAEHVARQKSKRKRQQADTTKQNKKYKEFKF